HEDGRDLCLGHSRVPRDGHVVLCQVEVVRPEERVPARLGTSLESPAQIEELLDRPELSEGSALPPAQSELGDVGRVEHLAGIRVVGRDLRAIVDEITGNLVRPEARPASVDLVAVPFREGTSVRTAEDVAAHLALYSLSSRRAVGSRKTAAGLAVGVGRIDDGEGHLWG